MESIYNLDSKIGKQIRHQGKDFVFFSGTSYLGMGEAKAFEEKITEGFRLYGISHGLSRINNVRLDIYGQFESRFAAEAGADDAIVWSSGFLAGMTAVGYLATQHQHVWIAPGTHPAVLPSEVSIQSHASRFAWETWCREEAERLPASNILILSNSVDVLHPTVHDFDWIKELPAKHRYTLLIDDSHGFGVLGGGIYGCYRLWKNLPVDLLISGSLGKGLSMPAGIILGPKDILDGIRLTATYRGASPPPPAYLFAFLEGVELFENQRKKLLSNMSFAHSLDTFGKLDHDPRFPVFGFKDFIWVEHLEKSGFIVSSFPYPTSNDPCINRIVVTAAHDVDDLERMDPILTELFMMNQV